MTERQYIVALSAFTPFGGARVNLLISFFGSARKAWTTSEKKLQQIGLNENIVNKFITHRKKFDFEDYFNRLNSLHTKFLIKGERLYPHQLAQIEGPPYVLYLRGNEEILAKDAISIVGSRKMTSYGREVTEKFAGELAGYGLVIVSGLARGIDTVAHKSALEVSGKTVAVLGCGIDIIYPPENTNLAKEIIESGGCLISEYPLGFPALRANFAARNRIISGLSRAIVVVEGAQKSGTLLTASHAAEQGRSVFAIPGQITSPLSAAPLFLLKNGARLATTPKDIVEELDLEVKVDKEAIEKVLPTTEEEESFLEILTNEPLHLDEVARISGLDAGNVSARLTVMELKGLVRNIGNGVYKKI